MSRTIYANLQVWDPMGQMKLEPGLLYGGQSMLFVLAAEDLATGLLRLIDAVAQKGLGLIRVVYAGYTENFEEDHFPYLVELEPMVADAIEMDRICAIGPYTFAPADAPESENVMLACLDILDRAEGTSGAICLGAVEGGMVDGLRALLGEMREKGIVLHHLEDAKDASEHAEVFSFETKVEDMITKARAAQGPVYSDSIGYEDS